MIVPARFGHLSPAHVARLCLNLLVAQTELAQRYGNCPDVPTIRDFRALLVALPDWPGIARPALLASFSQVITEEGGWLIAGSSTTHPVSLAIAGIPVPPAGTLPAHPPPPAPAQPGAATRRPRKSGR